MPTTAPPPLVRRKAAAGDAQTFENSLATIGRSFLAPKAPGLFKHEIGFQVLDQDDDNSRAVGVFGFRVGSRLLYVPVFYRNGVVKGTEQLRDPKRKACVPLTDQWVNKFLSEQGDQPAEAVHRSALKDTAQPSLWQLKYPPTKYAADWVGEARVDLARALSRAPGPPVGPAAPDLIKVAQAHPALLAEIGRWASAYPWFSDALDRFHGRAKVAAALAAAPTEAFLFAPGAHPAVVPPGPAPRTKAAAALTVVRVSTVRLHNVGRPGGPRPEMLFDPHEWDTLRDGDNVYRDRRGPEITSKVTAWVGGRLPDGEVLSNPSEHGVYEVLVEGHKFEPCAVLTPLVGPGPAIGRCLVVRLADKAWKYTHPNAVWVRGQADQPALREWVETLPRARAAVDGVPAGTHAGIARVTENPGAGGFEATVPFDYHTGPGGSHTYFHSNPDYQRPFWAAFDPWEDNPNIHAGSRRSHADPRVEVFDECSRPVLHDRQLYLPAGCYLVPLDGKRLQLGDGTDPERVLFARRRNAKDTEVKVEKLAAGYVWSVPAAGWASPPRDAADLEADLVEHLNLPVADAKTAAAHAVRYKSAGFLVKYAAPPDTGAAGYGKADGLAGPVLRAADRPGAGKPYGLWGPPPFPDNWVEPKVPEPAGAARAQPYYDTHPLLYGDNPFEPINPAARQVGVGKPQVPPPAAAPAVKPAPPASVVASPLLTPAEAKPIATASPANRDSTVYGPRADLGSALPAKGNPLPVPPVEPTPPPPAPGVVPGFAKAAAPPDMGLAHDWPNSPVMPFDQISAPASFADDVVPTETGSAVAVPVQDMLMQPGAAERYRPYPVDYGVKTRLPGVGNDGGGIGSGGDHRSDLSAVATAARSGRRELFDTAALAALVKHKRLRTLLEESRADLGRAVTRLGDNLAHLYWNQDEWADQFGEGEVGPLEDQIRSQFEKLGDLVLTLQEKAPTEGLDPGILPALAPADGSESAN